MSTLATILVTGGTGNQGGAVARCLIEKGFRVKVLTRHPASAAAEKLKKYNIELVQGNLDNPQTFSHHLKEVEGIFSVQTFENGVTKEVKQGILLADLAKQYGINHFIYSSGAGAELQSGIPHWESKLTIENHIRQLGLSYTILRPTSLFENFLLPPVRARLVKGKLVSPIHRDIVQQFISAQDIGRVSTAIFTNPEHYRSQTITLAAQQLSLTQVAHIFSQTLGKEITYQQVPWLISRLVMGRNLHKMFQWVNRHGGVFSPAETVQQTDFPDFLDLQQWSKLHFKTT